MSWEWPTQWQATRIDPRVVKLLHGAGYVTIGLIGLGLIPWRRAARVENPCYGRSLVWILAWIIVPAYAFYCVSMGAQSRLSKGVWTSGFVSPNLMLMAIEQLLAPLRWW